MISLWWLLLIIPLSFVVGAFLLFIAFEFMMIFSGWWS